MTAATLASPEQDFGVGRAWDVQGDDLFDGLHLHQRVLNWRMDSLDAARSDAQHGLAELRRDQAALEALRNELASAAQLKAMAAQTQAESQKLLEAERRHCTTMASRVEQEMQTSAKLRDQHELRLRELDRAEAAVAEKRREAAERMAKLDAFLGLYAERLGLCISRIAPQTVRVTFSLLDEADPDRQFSFTLGLASSTAYSVTDCSMKLPTLDALVRRLNCDPDSPSALAAFACSMRRAFKESCGVL
jgi:multidrug efflux pump subunit AcrA (membrane-fusion protein)